MDEVAPPVAPAAAHPGHVRPARYQKFVTAIAAILAIVGCVWLGYWYGHDIGEAAVWAIVSVTGAHAAGNVGEHYVRAPAS